MKEIREIHLTLAPCAGSDNPNRRADGCIERASFTPQDDVVEGEANGDSPTRVAYRYLDGDPPDDETPIWRVSCRTPRRDSHWRLCGDAIGIGGTVDEMIAWLNADPALRENGGTR